MGIAKTHSGGLMISRRQFFLRSGLAAAGLANCSKSFAVTPTSAALKPCHHYTRLFTPGPASTPGSPTEKRLIDLAKAMKDPLNSDGNEDSSGDSTIFAGYTYLGQFIDHDLTLDITPLDQVKPDNVEYTRNFRNPFLNLDHLYGDSPNISSFLYRRHAPQEAGEERFLLGSTAQSSVVGGASNTANTLPSSCNDLPRNSQGIALVGDPRQDENLILAQMHVAFLKLHNLFLDEPQKIGDFSYYKIDPPFEAAKRVLTWHYQWIVRNEFLSAIIDPTVFNRLDKSPYRSALTSPLRNFQIPVEFSAAAFRFGHSMVRHQYHYNFWHDKKPAVLLDDLFQRTGFGQPGNVPVPETWVIEWNRFFPLRDKFHIEKARKIDTNITEDLYYLLPPQLRAFSAVTTSKPKFATADPPELPIRTLLRGSRMGLPTAQTVAETMRLLDPKIRILESKEIASGPQGYIVKQYGFDRQTPLWYYILKEAEVINGGEKLGPIGSRIVADVILASLAADPNSYVNVAGRDWKPTLQISGIADMLALVTPDKPTKACSST